MAVDLVPANDLGLTENLASLCNQRHNAGERFEAKFGRIGLRWNFAFDGEWNGKRYGAKQVEAYAVEEDGWLVITVIVRFF